MPDDRRRHSGVRLGGLVVAERWCPLVLELLASQLVELRARAQAPSLPAVAPVRG